MQTMPNPAISVQHDAAGQRFTSQAGGQTSEACYHQAGTTLVMTHTGVPAALAGRGIAAALVQAALDHARAQGLTVRPQCSYVRAYMQRHPESLDLLEAP